MFRFSSHLSFVDVFFGSFDKNWTDFQHLTIWMDGDEKYRNLTEDETLLKLELILGQKSFLHQ